MTTDQQPEERDMVRSISLDVGTGTLAAIAALVVEDSVEHTPATPSDHCGPAALVGCVGPFLSTFADFELVEDDIIADGDKVVSRFLPTGTHEKAFMHIPPLGEEIDVKGSTRDRIEDGRATETWTGGDTVGLTGQLRAIPNDRRYSPA